MPSHRIIGLAGTGKTTWSLKEIDNLLQLDIGVDQIAHTTFSAKMANANRYDIMNRFDLDNKDLYNVGTIHGLCRRLLNVDIDEALITSKDIRKFGDVFGITTKGRSVDITNPDDLLSTDGGMLLLSVDAWLRNTLNSFDDIDQYPGYEKLLDEFDVDIVPDFMDAYHHYKIDNGKVDFTDLLENVCEDGYGMNATAFFTDEAQDLNPLLNKTCDTLKQDAEYDYLVGDPFQSIYQFMGADSCFLMAAKVDSEAVLPVTYRYGQDVIDFSKDILLAGGHCDIPNLSSSKMTNVTVIDTDAYFDIVPDITESTFHLVRCNYQGYPIAQRLIDCGIPFTGLFGWTNNDISIYNALFDIHNSGYVEADDLASLIRIHPDNFFNASKKDLLERLTNAKKLSYSVKDIKDFCAPLSLFTKSNFLTSLKNPLAFADIGETQFSRITHVLEMGVRRLSREKINTSVLTIHGSKGMQADAVFVWDETNKTIVNGMDEVDSLLHESNVWYVAATRCKRNLYWVNSNKRFLWEVSA